MMKKSLYSKPKVLNKEELRINESVASCEYPATVQYWASYEIGGAETPDENNTRTTLFPTFRNPTGNPPSGLYNGSVIPDGELEVVLKLRSDHIKTYEQAMPTIVGVYIVNIPGVGFYEFEDYYPHSEPSAASYEANHTIVVPQGFSYTDNWQDVEGVSLPSPINPADGYSSVVFKS